VAQSLRPIVIGITSDHHCGSTVGVCPEEGVRLPDSAKYVPSKAQVWLWRNWLDFHEKLKAEKLKQKADLYYIINGDMYEGDHHGTHQIISRDADVQGYVADRIFGVIRDMKPKRIWVVRGTRSHVGSNEEHRARWLGAEQDADTKTYSRYHLRVRAHGLILDAQHHGKMGQLPRTERSNMIQRAYDILAEYAGRGLEAPNLVFRSHLHRYGDSGRDHRHKVPRILQLPSWKLKDDFGHKVATNSLADVGGVIVSIQPDGEYDIKPVLYQPTLPKLEEI